MVLGLTLALVRFLGPAGRSRSVVLVSIDTLRADHLPTYGYGKIRTPAIDELAGSGVVFENCYTHVPLTLPAHTSLFTGLLPPAHGVRNNVGFKVATGARTLAGDLRQEGYVTGGAVSAYVLHSATGISQGFDWYDDDLKATAPGTPDTEIQRDGMETVDRALAWLKERPARKGLLAGAEGPVFLFVHLYEPHTPYTPPARFRGRDKAPYDGEIMYADELLGRLFAGLRRLDLYDPSLIVLLSDHGEALGDHGEPDHGVFLYREVMRVPLIVKVPGAKEGGNRLQAPVQLIDIAPTILDWAGLAPSPKLPGQSLLPALRGGGLPHDRRIYAESQYGRLHFGWKELFSLTDARYSFILAPRQELYDIQRDPQQVHDLLARGESGPSADPALPGPVAREYETLHRALRIQVEKAGLRAPDPVGEEELAKLRALGYIGTPTLDSSSEAAPDPKDRIGDLVLYRQAIRMKESKMFARVAATLGGVVATSPRMIDAWDELSEVWQRLGDREKAVDALKQGLRVAPHRTVRRLELVDLLVQLGRYDEARKELEVAASRQPEEAEVWRAYIEAVEGRPDAAREFAARGLPAAVPFLEGILSYGKQDFPRAVSWFRKALDALQGRSVRALPHVGFYLGDALARESARAEDEAGRTRLRQEAEKSLLDELTLQPANASAVSSLCFLHATARDLRKVREVLTGFARENPSVATYELSAELCRRMGLTQDAAQWNERARAGTGP